MILVFVMGDCPACMDYKPRFEKQVKTWIDHGVPLYWYRGGQVPRGVIPILMLDATSDDPTIVGLADQHQVTGLPSTILLTRHGKPVKLEGSVEDRQVYDLLHAAVLANR